MSNLTPPTSPTQPPAPLAGGTAQATGAREAELREAILKGLCAMSGETEHEEHLMSAITPLLDRREGELAALRTLVAKQRAVLGDIHKTAHCISKAGPMHTKTLDEAWNKFDELSAKATAGLWLSLSTPAIADELAARDALFKSHTEAVGAFLKELFDIMVDPLTEDLITVEEMRFHLLAAAKRSREDAAQLTSAQSALRESEAARGEDSKRLDWLEAQQGESLSTLHLSQCGSGGMGRSWFKKQIRAAIDDARAQEAKT